MPVVMAKITKNTSNSTTKRISGTVNNTADGIMDRIPTQ